MNCFAHRATAAVGICAACNRAVCHECVGIQTPRVICQACCERGATLGFEYRSRATLGGWPLVHVCSGVDPATMRPRVARGVIAIGNVAVGGIAAGGLAIGLVAVGGGAFGLLAALGGAAIGLGLSVGGLAVGAVALGGGAMGYVFAVGGGAVGPATIDGMGCDAAAREFVVRWLGTPALPPNCR